MNTIIGFIVATAIFVAWRSSIREEKEKQQEWESYLQGLTEKQCFAVSKDKSQTKFTDEQRSESYRRGCELRRIRELGE